MDLMAPSGQLADAIPRTKIEVPIVAATTQLRGLLVLCSAPQDQQVALDSAQRALADWTKENLESEQQMACISQLRQELA
jgi:hypothetical protein